MTRIRALLAAATAGSLLLALRRRRRSPSAVGRDTAAGVKRAGGRTRRRFRRVRR